MTDAKFDKMFRIKDTKYDRHRKVTKEMSDEMFLLRYRYSWTLKKISDKFGVAPATVLYNIDPDYRTKRLSECCGNHTGNTFCTFANRVAYKKSIVTELICKMINESNH